MNRGMGFKEYRDWQRAVLERDNHTCQDCGYEANHAHHIKGWWEAREERFHVANGRALCKSCHEAIHGYTFGSKKKTVPLDEKEILVFKTLCPKTYARQMAI